MAVEGQRRPDRQTRLLMLLWWLTPIAFLLWLDRDGLQVWFFQDDFAWLGLLRLTHSFYDLLTALFSPEAQGTIRPWSERGFFLLFEYLFGLDSLPFRICVFITMAANLTLVAWITRRITGSQTAGFLAPVFWIANAALATVMSWNSAFNEALCPLFMLSAMALFMRWDETGRRKFWWWQLVVFVVGFGALEINVVYPALAGAYVLFVAAPERRRRLLISLTPLFAISVVYFFWHRSVAPLPASGAYAVHFDTRIIRTLGKYWHWSLLPEGWLRYGHSRRRGEAIFWVATLALLLFVVREISRRRYLVGFFLSWFAIALAPMTVLPEHASDYYLTIPLIGLSMLGAWGVACVWRPAQRDDRTWLGVGPLQIVVLLMLVIWLGAMISGSRAAIKWWVSRSGVVRAMVLGVDAAHQAHPAQTIVLDHVTSALFDDGIAHSAFYPIGLDYVYLTPGSEANIHPSDNPGMLDKLVLEPPVMRRAITHEEVVVYSVVGDHLRNITDEWTGYASHGNPRQEARRIEVGNPLLTYLLGPEWHRLESGVRWMPQRATVRLGGPGTPRERLLLEGYCPDEQLNAGPLHLFVSVDGISLARIQISNPETNFRRLLDLPPSTVGRPTVEVSIAVDKVIHEAGGRELGLVFGTIAIQP